MEKVGLAMGYDPSMTVREIADVARRAELRGYDMAFFSEALHSNRDSVTVLTACSLATQSILLGCTQVVRLRTPLLMAQSLASVDELANGRIVLSAGACTAAHAKRHGLPTITPAVTLTDWIEAVRLLLTGEKITYRGQSVQLEGVGLNWVPKRHRIPIWIAAISTTGLRLAGQFADGVLLDAHTSAEYAENAIRILKEAVLASNRDWSEFEVAQIVPCSVEVHHEKAVDAVRWEAASRFESPQFPLEMQRRLRVGEPALDPQDFPSLMAALEKGGKAAVARALPQTLIERTTACGTPEEVVERVQRYRSAGVKFPLIRPQGRHQIARILDLFARK
jgi:alkanesulfonate monooxygenase SsuD/methylene tetrahydromethanopterin reductase-like flavin-dependent oxidoreductase (luciferase family)